MSAFPGRPLDNVRILDLSRVLAGPWCTQLMADFGADVIKVERPGAGDDTRSWGPPFVDQGDGERVAAYFCCANRGKKSVALDIGNPAHRDAIIELAGRVDVVVENFKTGTLERYGLGYEALRRRNPRLVYCSITGYGKTGPYADRPGYDAVLQGVAGLMSVTGEKDGEPGAGPQKVGVPLTDILTGVYAAYGIVTALWERERSGEGQRIDLSLLDVLVTSMATLAVPYFASGVVPTRQGNTHASVVPSDIFACADGPILVTVGNDAQFRKLCQALAASDLAADERYATNEGRVRHREALVCALRELMAHRQRLPLIQALSDAGVPAGPLNDLRQTFADPQVQHAGLTVDFPLGQGAGGQVKVLGSPLKFSRTPAQYDRPPPGLGEHTEAVMAALSHGREGA
ncbi:CaiB/BaiF CoA transferase family protein [Verticiella sediminum]|nr:CaiB/BaiF CoA-transferase family protein [Verticiella sediminum]